MKRTYQPSVVRRKRTHGFLVRMATRGGPQGHRRSPRQGPSSSRRLMGAEDACEARPPLPTPRARQLALKIRQDSASARPSDCTKRMSIHPFCFQACAAGRWFNLHYCPNTLGHARIGLVVAKKLARRAVQRNLVKRIGRDLFRHAQADLPAHDLVLRLSAKLDNVTRRMMREDMNSLLGRLPKK